jgi:hypothetical protein
LEVEMVIARGGFAAIAAVVLGSVAVSASADVSLAVRGLRATAYDEIPAGSAFDIEPADGSEFTLQVERMVEASLQRAGYARADDSPLVLTLATEMTDPGAETPWPVQLGASKGSLRMRLFLLGPNSSGLLQESRSPAAGDYRIFLSIHDRRTLRYVWRGTATACRCGAGALASSRTMVPALVEAIGRNVGPQAVASTPPR